MEYLWLLWGFLVLIVVLGDVRTRNSVYIPPEQAALIEYSTWPMWKEIEPPDTRIRILWILHDYVPFVNAGSEICTHTINRHLMKKPYKYDVWVASPGFPQRTFEGVRCFDVNDTKTLFDVMKTTHQFHSHSYYYRKQMQWCSRVTGRPFVEWVHTDNYVRAVGKPWIDPRLKGRQWTVFNSKSLRSTRIDVPDSACAIFVPMVDYREYGRVEGKEGKERKYVTLSNVNDNKGGNLLVQLAKALPDVEFLGVKGGYRKQITVSDVPNLKYIEHTPKIRDVYAQTWVQIMPSKEETWGRTAVEAMSSGIPVIVSPTPGLRECCEQAAIYCDRNDLDAWVAAIRHLKRDGEHYKKMSTVALERARALDPVPDIERMEDWICGPVQESAFPVSRDPTFFEKNMLFR